MKVAEVKERCQGVLDALSEIVVGKDRRPAAGHGRDPGQRPYPHRGLSGPGQDPDRAAVQPGPRAPLQPHPVHAGPAARATSPAARSTSSARAASNSGAARSSPIWCWPTRSTAPRRRPNRRCWRRCRSGRSPSTGSRYPLDPPFLVIATQNPIELEGTYPLPEAQLDRFLMRISVGYPEAGRGEGDAATAARAAPGRRGNAARSCRTAFFWPCRRHSRKSTSTVRSTSTSSTWCGRPATTTGLRSGVSPRGALALQSIVRAEAALQGRDFVTPDDVKAMAVPVLAHRIVLRPELWVARAVAGRGRRRHPEAGADTEGGGGLTTSPSPLLAALSVLAMWALVLGLVVGRSELLFVAPAAGRGLAVGRRPKAASGIG